MGKKRNNQVSTERLVIDPNKFNHRMDSDEIESHLHTRLKGSNIKPSKKAYKRTKKHKKHWSEYSEDEL